MLVFFNGLMLGLSLIMALGPQNIFLIRQGAMRRHAMLSALTCFACDMVLISASVVGLHHVLELYPNLQTWMLWFGAGFLMYYGIKTLHTVFYPRVNKSKPVAQPKSRRQIIALALGFSLLNPHAIIDSLVLIGGGSSRFPDHQQAFMFGVITSSLLWFSVLTCTTYYFSNALTRATVWRRVEFFSGILMVYLGIKLIFSSF